MQVRYDGAAREKVDPVKEGLPELVTKPFNDIAIKTPPLRPAVYNFRAAVTTSTPNVHC